MIVTNPFNATAQELAAISRRWWTLLVIGVATIVAGTIILYTDWSLSDLAVFVGALLVFRGFMTLFSLPVDGSSAGWSIAAGLLEIAVGVMVWAWPGPTLLVIAYAIGWYVLFSGIFTIAGSISGRDVLPYWGWMLAFGIIEVALAFWLLGQPGITLVAAVLALGLWCIVYGVIEIILGFEVKRLGSEPARVEHDLRTMSQDQLSHATH